MANLVHIKADEQEAKMLIAKLKRLERRDARKILRKAFREGAKIILPAARANAPKDSGLLKRSIRVRASKRSRRYIGAVVTTREGMFQGETFYGGFQEWGWHAGKRAKSSKSYRAESRKARAAGESFMGRKFIPGKHFMENAGKTHGRAAATKATVIIREGIEAVARK